MSVRAYRIIEIEIEENPSFNLWHDHNLRNFLDEDGQLYSHLASNGTGMTDVPVKKLRKAIKMAAELNLDEKTINQLKKDIAAAKSSKDECIAYFCY
jgi:Rod binding domain-containing protein